MELSRVDFVYLIANVGHMYIVYLSLKLFLEGKVRNRKETAITYIMFYISICLASMVICYPIVTMLINIIMYFVLTGQYQVKFQKRLLIVFNVYVMLMISEIIVGTFMGYYRESLFEIIEFKSTTGMIIAKMFSVIVLRVLGLFKNIKKDYRFPTKYWSALIIIPINSLYLVILIIQSDRLEKVQVLMGLIAIMAIDFLSFYMYDIINQNYNGKIEKVMLEERNMYYAKRLLSMKDSVQSVRKLQHDWKNHLIELGILVQEEQKEKALEYLERVNGAIYSVKSYVNTGNLDVDGILNYKLQEADKEGIKVNFQANIPEQLNICAFDCAVILGNLLDNAIEGAKTCKEGKRLDGKLSFSKGNLFLMLENSHAGNIESKNDTIITSKKDKENHGFGLKNVRAAVERYCGSLNISYDNTIFRVDLLMYLG